MVSIICPLFNKLNYISETLDSVINQTYQNWEMIIVDDGSTDGSYELVFSNYNRDGRIRLCHRTDFKENKGGSVCRNIGIAQAKGEYIMFLDADDLMDRECLENRMKMQARFPEQDMYLFPQMYFKGNIHNKEKPRGWNWLDKLLYKSSKNKKDYFLKRFLKYYLPWTISNVLWRKTALIRIGGFDEQFQRLQDPEIHTKALLQEEIKIKDLLFSQKPDVFIRLDEERHQGSIGSQKEKYKHFLKSAEQFVSKFKKHLQTNNKYKYLKYLSVHLILTETNINSALASCGPDDDVFYSSLKAELAKFREAEDIRLSRFTQSLVNLHQSLVHRSVFRKMKLPTLINLFFVYSGIH